MSALLIVRSGSVVIGQCDAVCYDAKHTRCVCICGGLAHGVGRERAIILVRHLANRDGHQLTNAVTEPLFEVAA